MVIVIIRMIIINCSSFSFQMRSSAVGTLVKKVNLMTLMMMTMVVVVIKIVMTDLC